ncbi:hypothetical protein [Salinactinospora qingdaonensis]|uniref:hypothetical protein n=1 Tax=Salinactinospora qingdaonensis TaxID=702744 RepID=UPI0031E66B94
MTAVPPNAIPVFPYGTPKRHPHLSGVMPWMREAGASGHGAGKLAAMLSVRKKMITIMH